MKANITPRRPKAPLKLWRYNMEDKINEINEDNDTVNLNRVAVVTAVKDILFSGLSILGISAIEKM